MGATALDKLTGLPARPALESALAKHVDQARKNGGSVSVVLADIDLFGRLNKAYGRSAGDSVLKSLGALFVAAWKSDGQSYRFGGDAFGVVIPGTEKEQAFLQLEALRERIAADFAVPEGDAGATARLSISAGVASFPDDGVKPLEIVNKAAEALYRAKVGGRNKVCLAREEKMVTKTSHYTQGQLMGLRRLAEREQIGEALLLREALNDVLRKYNA